MVTEDPIPNQAFSPVPLHVGSALIRPEDKHAIAGQAVESMNHYANQEVALLRKQAELIMAQVKEIEERVKISEWIYQAECRFKPTILGIYHLYEKEEGKRVLSMVGPNEWGRSAAYRRYIASVKLLGDHTWEIIRTGEQTSVETTIK